MEGSDANYMAKHDLQRIFKDLLTVVDETQPERPLDAAVGCLVALSKRREDGDPVANYQDTFRTAIASTIGGEELNGNGEVGSSKAAKDLASFSWDYEPDEAAQKQALNEAPSSTRHWSEAIKNAAAKAVSAGPPKYPESFNTGRRFSISAEPYNPSQTSRFHRVLIAKDESTRERIQKAVCKNLLFRSLDPEQLEQILDAMFEKKLPAGVDIIREGEEGDYFYVIDCGKFEVLKGDVPVVQLLAGDTFGELALMYGSPRTATVRSLEESIVWAVDRTTFRSIIIDLSFRKRLMYEGFLRSVPLLQTLHDSELYRVCDALQPTTFSPGETIVVQGECGNEFFIIEEGTAVVTMRQKDEQGATVEGAEAEVEVSRIGKGDYFGELALLRDAPRAATVRALSDVKCVILRKADFIRLLGPVMPILQRNQEHYRKYEEYLDSAPMAAISASVSLAAASAP